jgi:hypothetical protein
MQVTANAGDRKLVNGSLARPTMEKRRSQDWDAHLSTECIPKKAAPKVSPIASGELSESEAIRRACDGDRTVFERRRAVKIRSHPSEALLPYCPIGAK